MTRIRNYLSIATLVVALALSNAIDVKLSSSKRGVTSCSTRGGSSAAIAASSSFAATASTHIRVALAGGIAGAVGTAALYPMDTAKTLRQANPNTYKSVREALVHLVYRQKEKCLCKYHAIEYILHHYFAVGHLPCF